MFNAGKAVEALIDNDIDTIINGEDFGIDYLESILRNGHNGYESLQVFELVDLLNERGYDLEEFFGDKEE